jgi:hypothetical protein
MKSTEQVLFDKREAATFLGCSVRHFETEIRPHVAVIDLARAGVRRPMPRWHRDDLLAFIAKRRAA